MKFKVGGRVRIIACGDPSGFEAVGAEATVLAVGVLSWALQPGYVALSVDGSDEEWRFLPSQLEPLTRPGLNAEYEKFVKDLQDALFSKLPDFNPKPRQGEIVQAGDV